MKSFNIKRSILKQDNSIYSKIEKYIFKLRNYLHKKSSLYKKLSVLYYLYLYPIRFKITYLKKANGKNVIFYPQKPHPMEILYKVFHMRGYKITNNPHAKSNIVISYEDITVRTNNDIRKYLNKSQTVINEYCLDISKKTVEKMFKKVFGYGLTINPQKYKNSYVKKSNLNAKHDGKIYTKLQTPKNGYVYQKVINNQLEDMILDFRVPYIMGTIPFVYLKYRPLKTRFSNTNSYVNLSTTKEIFSNSEIVKISKFCKLMGVDYAELDILRDGDNGKIYIADVNNTPSGPPNHIQKRDYWKALALISNTFLEKVERKIK